MARQTQLLLTFDEGFKTIPYIGAARPEGSICHGFRLLKGKPADEARAIPEAADVDCIADALIRINQSGTSFFTVGCEKAFNTADGGFWARGYIEFSINYADKASDATWYFVLFFHFNEFIKARNFDGPVQFHWELQGCSFLDADRTMGYVATVWITTPVGPSPEVVRNAWCAAVTLLADYLETRSMKGEVPIYTGPNLL